MGFCIIVFPEELSGCFFYLCDYLLWGLFGRNGLEPMEPVVGARIWAVPPHTQQDAEPLPSALTNCLKPSPLLPQAFRMNIQTCPLLDIAVMSLLQPQHSSASKRPVLAPASLAPSPGMRWGKLGLAQPLQGLFHTMEMLYLLHFPRDITFELIFMLFFIFSGRD